MPNKLTPQQIRCAVDWWMDAMRKPIFDNLGSRAAAAKPQELVASTMANRAAAYNRPSEEEVTTFGKSLQSTLERAGESLYEWYQLSVDYSPCCELREAMSAAGLNPSNIAILPWKTRMHFRDGGVQVSCGYGAELKEILLNDIG